MSEERVVVVVEVGGGEKTSLINENEIQRRGKIWDKRNEARMFRANLGVKGNSE